MKMYTKEFKVRALGMVAEQGLSPECQTVVRQKVERQIVLS